MKYTKAPWKVHLDGLRQDHMGICRVILLDLPSEGKDVGNAVDDKNLIEAAPDLYNALSAAVIHLEDIASGWAAKAPEDDLKYMKKALNKAEGKL